MSTQNVISGRVLAPMNRAVHSAIMQNAYETFKATLTRVYAFLNRVSLRRKEIVTSCQCYNYRSVRITITILNYDIDIIDVRITLKLFIRFRGIKKFYE